MSFLNILKGRKATNDCERVINKNTAITADVAYKISRFGTNKTDAELLNDFLEDVKSRVKSKSYTNSYNMMIDVDIDIVKFLPQIVEKLSKVNGFKIIILDENTIITNTATNKTDHIAKGLTSILLFWDRESILEIQEENSKNIEQTNNSSSADNADSEDKKFYTNVTSGNEKQELVPLNS